MSKTQLIKSTGLVNFEIIINGKPLADAYNVISIEVSREVNSIPRATVAIAIVPGEKLNPGTDNALIPGSEIEIKLGYEQNTGRVFKGLITAQSIRSNGTGNHVLSLHSQDEAIELTKEMKSNTFESLSDSQIIQQIVSEYGLDSEVENSGHEFPQLIQYQEKDWDFILKRAAANGMIVYPEDGVVKVERPLESGSSVLNLTNGMDINDIELTLASNQQKSGRVVFQGSSIPMINTIINISGFSKHFDGDVLITRVRHLLREGNWKTEVGFGLSADILHPSHTMATSGAASSILTRSGLKIQLDDEENIVNILTPNGNTCVLSDRDGSILLKDEHGNEMEMTAAGINLKSTRDITLDATGNIKLKANQKIDIKSSGGEVSIDGLNVIANGQVSATVKGGAKAELSAGGQTTVKGAMVMIN
ncbi:hypothetical protein CEQ90_10275 [Lewinellaceae bacterium SD302]|nr:hypothetical protein CEQ90_10275 [Lewinellaceae bacterium SD302]